MNVQSPDAARQRPENAIEVPVHRPAEAAPNAFAEITPIPRHTREFEVVAVYPAEAAAVSRGRHQLHRLMVRTGLSAIADAVILGAHELMANAATHGCRGQAAKAFTVKVIHSGGRIRVEVQDPSNRRPRQRPPSEEREGGRGLFLVDALAASWGFEPGPGQGKTVWMELDVPTTACVVLPVPLGES